MPPEAATPRPTDRPARPVASRAVRGVQLLLALEVLVFAGSTIPGVRSAPGFDRWLDGRLQGAAYVTTAVLCVLRPVLSPVYRTAWAWIAAGLAARAVGFVLFLAIVREQHPVPYPSVADAAWLTMPVLLGIGLVRLARQQSREVLARVSLDGVIGALACAGLALALLYGTLVKLTAPGLAAHVVATNIAYPITDLLLLFLILGVLATYEWRPPISLWVLGAGVTAFAVTDGAFLYEVTEGTFRPGSGISALSLGATAAIAFSPYVSRVSGPGPARTAVPQMAAPVVAALTCLALLVVASRHDVVAGVVVLATAGLLLAVVRTALAVRALQRVTRALQDQQARLRVSEAHSTAEADRLSAVVAGITEYGVIAARQTHVTFFSPGAERMLGYRADEVIGKHTAEHFNLPEELERRAAELGVESGAAALVAGATPAHAVTREWTYVRRDGSRFPVELTITGLGDGEYLGVARDVTREQTLARARATREALLPILAPGREMDEALQAAIRTVAEEMGWDTGMLWTPAGDHLGARHLWQRPEIADEAWADGVRALRVSPGQGITGEIWVRGEPGWIEDVAELEGLTDAEDELRTTIAPHQRTMVVVPIRGAAETGAPLGVLQLVGRSRPRDPDLMEVLDTVASTIGRYIERERADHELRAARDAAQLADRAKSVFVSRISHELRTPLNAILGFAQLLGRDTEDPLQQERIAQILAGGRHLTDMIDDLLDVALVERGEMGVSLEAVSATDVLREVLDLTRPLIHERDLELEVDAHDGLYQYVHADYQRLRQVLLNLISNAVKYNRPRGSIRVSFDAGDAGRLRFLVRDTGPGIDPARLPQMFRPFERLGAEDGPEQGTGLGLFVSKGLVEAMGGELTVRSVPGEGSTFIVDLPRAQASEVSAVAAGHAAAPPAAALPDHPATVLYVEDNVANIRLVRDILSRQPQVELLVATDGLTGLALARERDPDLILLDVNLPDLQGDEILQILREEELTRETPVIVISADASAGQERRFLLGGADAYLTKPLDVDAFVAAVTETLQPARTPEAAIPRTKDPDVP